jgi:chromosome segregation ATPase
MTTEDLPNGQPITSFEMLRSGVDVVITDLILHNVDGDALNPSEVADRLRAAVRAAQHQYAEDRVRWEQDRADKDAAVRVYTNTRRKVEELQVESTEQRNQIFTKDNVIASRGTEIEKLRERIAEVSAENTDQRNALNIQMGKLGPLRQACEEAKDVLSAIADSAMAGMGLKLKWADQARRNLEDALEKNAETNE